jgi:hypothetical protein
MQRNGDGYCRGDQPSYQQNRLLCAQGVRLSVSCKRWFAVVVSQWNTAEPAVAYPRRFLSRSDNDAVESVPTPPASPIIAPNTPARVGSPDRVREAFSSHIGPAHGERMGEFVLSASDWCLAAAHTATAVTRNIRVNEDARPVSVNARVRLRPSPTQPDRQTSRRDTTTSVPRSGTNDSSHSAMNGRTFMVTSPPGGRASPTGPVPG